ncbi:MAG: VWA domain-containing protein, partial [Acidobacteriota bacterium]
PGADVPALEAPEGDEPAEPRLRPGRLPVPEDQRLHLVLYLDNQFLRPFNRNRVVRQVREFLRTQIGPQDRVMLITYDRELHRRHPFTSDMQAINDALDETLTLTGAAAAAETERRDAMRRVEQSRTELEAQSHADFYAKSVHHDLGLSIDALKKLVGSLAGLPGRKALLYVSDGIPMTPGEDLFLLVAQRFTSQTTARLQGRRYNSRQRFRDLTAQANANRVTFYTLEAAGLDFHASLSAEHRGSASATGGSNIDIDVLRDSNNQQALQMMAFETGGLATFNSNNIAGALGRMASDFGSYYSLGYQPGLREEGRYHKIEVKVKRKGLQVRHRSGYRDKTAETQVAEGTLASLFYGWEKNSLGVVLQAAKGQRQDDGNFVVPLEVRIPLGNVTFVPQETLHLGQLQISVAVIDEEGRVSSVQQTPVPIEIPDAHIATARQQSFVYEVSLIMREGYQEVAVGVRDEFPGETSFVRLPVWAGGVTTGAGSRASSAAGLGGR